MFCHESTFLLICFYSWISEQLTDLEQKMLRGCSENRSLNLLLQSCHQQVSFFIATSKLYPFICLLLIYVCYFHMFVHLFHYKNAYNYFEIFFLIARKHCTKGLFMVITMIYEHGNYNDIWIIYFNLFTCFHL